jgi:type I restriction enzyme S subunit
MGQAPYGSTYNDQSVGLPLIAGASDLGELTPAPTRWTSRPTQTCRKGDIILCIRATIGDRNWADRDYCLGRGVAGLRAHPGKLYPRYLWHWLGCATANLLHAARGATFLQVSRRDIENLVLPIPTSFSEQRRIADILDKADTIRRKRKEAIGLTEELLRSAFLEMVGPGAPAYGNWSVRTIASLAAGTPNSMRTGPFGSDLLHSEFVDEGIAVLGIDNAVQNRFTWGERRFITPEKFRKLHRYTVFPGDVIVTIMGTTGRSAVVPDDISTAITTKHLATITLNRNEAEPEFVSQALFRHPEVLRQIAAANRGAIMSGLNLGLIKTLRIPIPPPARQREFARVTIRIRELTKRMEGHRHEEELFSSLIARAFSGQLSVVELTC